MMTTDKPALPPATPGAANPAGILIGPNWFASVMGTGILAIAGKLQPIRFPGLELIITSAWLAATLLLIVLLIAATWNWCSRPAALNALLDDPVGIQFFGAPPMAILTVGTATMLVGPQHIGLELAMFIKIGCWLTGTILGFACAVLVTFRLFTRLQVKHDSAFGGWLMPVVPPMVSAAAAAQLIPYIEDALWRHSLLVISYSLFGMSLIASLVIISLIWSRLAHYGSSGGVRVPTLWIVLGPVGQSITAAGGLGIAAVAYDGATLPFAEGLLNIGLFYGLVMWGFMWLWMALAILLTWRAIRRQMGFALTWWSFTFPVGTCVTGTCVLSIMLKLPLFRWIALLLYAVLLCAWLLVFAQTLRGVISGKLLRPPLISPHPVARKE
ncbi:TDT family transporter [Chitinilyticum piscinae]|nr:TDT family transporter [Chitinilyticum piscinae]